MSAQYVGNYYLISHLVLSTGLTDRTIRNYIASGILQGEKINGLWHFTPEQVERFLRHPAVRPSILAKTMGWCTIFFCVQESGSRNAALFWICPELTEKKWRNSFATVSATGILAAYSSPMMG